MAEPNHYRPLEHDTRLHNSVVGVRKRKRPNAQKHGVYAAALVIPGEDSHEFEQLHAELINEWNPLGPTLRDAVFDLADLKWRKRRLRKYVQTQLSLNTFDPHHPAFDEVWGFFMFIGYLRSEPETCFEGEHARKYLRADRINHLKQKCPHSNYQSTEQWVQAVTSEILSFPRPGIAGFEPPEPEALDVLTEAQIDDLKRATREWKAEQQVAWSISQARELLEWESKESERLDARIARQIKFLFELKAMEEMLYKT